MKTVTDNFAIDEYRSRAFDLYFSGKTAAVYDIETTGLFDKHDRIMLTGVLTVKDGRAKAKQFFAETLNDERKVIEATLAELSKADYLLTYNGRGFDDRFTVRRAAKYGIDAVLPYDLDLYYVLSKNSDIKQFSGGLRQKDVEHYLGLSDSRDDEIGGYESIKLYEQYLESPSYALEKTILLHNHDDICQLYRLLPALRQADVHKAFFWLGFPAGKFIVSRLSARSGVLSVRAVKTKDPEDYISFPTEEAPYSMRMTGSTGETEIDFPCETVEGGALVVDAEKILGDAFSPLKKYPAFASGYLIVKNGGAVNYLECNLFVKAFLEEVSA